MNAVAGRERLPEAKVEQYGPGSHKRHDLRIHDTRGRIALTGEVKLPGTPEGKSAFAESLVVDAHEKADRVQARFFFTWNVRDMILWDRQKWDVPLHERRKGRWELGIPVERPEDLSSPNFSGEGGTNAATGIAPATATATGSREG